MKLPNHITNLTPCCYGPATGQLHLIGYYNRCTR